ncbi:MAG: hydroxylamine oxidoreductase [Candidatus Marinimicrobia bacterium]|nr:hydroxylamine oxidoreductase [Candidatus Neomarinimicrobiota bacterium]MBT3617285.1 hydroxylamine oxidoreductase [Candidatus Neomarinimicrobiota bacterium]MBT3828848.1 hydroxylamine oxidoreductase [Candidatus Neomarinimicrobiota bacterium]MBT3997819.1 hydroxylamine oxidoreductase [Candidatus Neomarinimicrobiota bacterium]MBT4280533.1 hydroxylamine oxidoreductase [Candidatus Neomarinimicrobiota bacterium]
MGSSKDILPNELSEESIECLECHKSDDVSLYQQWGNSKHYGANVGCYECHKAEEGDADAFEHNDYLISIIVSPNDCARCHEKEVDEFVNSHHSKAGQIMGSLDNVLAEVVEGNRGFITDGFPHGNSAAAVNGCWQCHGSQVKVNDDGTLDPATWPNSGIGRINPDGSAGSCSACHQRHEFSIAQARRPENCGKCHLGPDHPQKEIYDESKHGINFYANVDKMNLESSKWVVGEDYNAAPTCATCHMSATPNQDISHNIGLRIKWNNRPVHSKLSHETDEKWGLESASIHADTRRENMEDVCAGCHNDNFTDNFFIQYEGLIDLYDQKFATPGEQLYKAALPLLRKDSDGNHIKFSDPIDFTWFELWHHEGRRARHGASMMAPDYTHWHGTYDLGKHFYSKFIPEIEEIISHGLKSSDRNDVKAAKKLQKLLTKTLKSENHRWFLGEMDPAEKARRKKASDEFKARYK